MSRLGVIGVIAALAMGCDGEVGQTPRGAELLFRTGSGCAQGCPNDRALLVGTEEIADVIGDVDLESMLVAVDDPSIAMAWVEPVRTCCAGDGAGASCRVLEEEAAVCDGHESKLPRVVIRALGPGSTTIQIGDDVGEIVTERILVEDAVVVTAVELAFDVDRFDEDVPFSQWIDGRVEHLALRAGEVAQLRFVVFDARGRMLRASEGVSARIDEPSIAEIGPALGACDGAVMEGDAIAIEGTAAGSAIIAVRAGSAGTAIALDVAAACDAGSIVLSDDACERDADCAPVECCHASACGAAARAPSCAGAQCTLECREGTIDCGGSCLCLEGRCAAYIPSTRDPTCDDPVPEPVEPVPPIFAEWTD